MLKGDILLLQAEAANIGTVSPPQITTKLQPSSEHNLEFMTM